MHNIRIIALYLPQFHPFPENDKWWGKGFTEWTSVARAQPLFKGHYQPRIPSDLGFYDLRLPIVREQQVELAKQAGIEGFCYWHYWFGNGKRLMGDIFDQVLASGKPDFPFCLGWANHSWYAKNWNTKDTKGKDKMLIEQKYYGENDYREHYLYLLKAFKDKRYIQYNGMPIFLIYRPFDLPIEIIHLFNKWAKEDGFKNGIYFIANIANNENEQDLLNIGFNAITKARISDIKYASKSNRVKSYFNQILNIIRRRPPYCFEYKNAMKYFLAEEDAKEYYIPSIIPNFDHSPRSNKYGIILHNSTPEYFAEHVKEVLKLVSQKENRLCILKSWNEWGEGNYMEPDLKYGLQYIKTLKNELIKINKNE